MFLWKCAKQTKKKLNKLTTEKLTEYYCLDGSGYRDRFISWTDTPLSSTLSNGGETSGSGKRGGMKSLYGHDSVQEIPPSLFWEVFTSGCVLFPLTARGWKLARGIWNEETSESCSRLTRNDGARMRGETVRRTRHFYAHEGKNWPRPWPNRCWQPSSELKILQIVVDNQKDGIIYKLGRQSLDDVRLRHLLRTGKNTSCPNVGWIFLFCPILYSYWYSRVWVD